MTGEEKKQRADAVSGQRASIIGVEVEVEVNLKLRVPMEQMLLPGATNGRVGDRATGGAQSK